MGFRIFGNVAAALLYGKVDMRMIGRNVVAQNATGLFEESVNITDDFFNLEPTLQMVLGLSWGSCLWNDKMFFQLSAGWETNYWWDQFNLIVPGPQGEINMNKAIILQGLTFQVKLDF